MCFVRVFRSGLVQTRSKLAVHRMLTYKTYDSSKQWVQVTALSSQNSFLLNNQGFSGRLYEIHGYLTNKYLSGKGKKQKVKNYMGKTLKHGWLVPAHRQPYTALCFGDTALALWGYSARTDTDPAPTQERDHSCTQGYRDPEELTLIMGWTVVVHLSSLSWLHYELRNAR